MPACSSKNRIIPVGIRGWFQNGWKEAKYVSHVEETVEDCWSWRTNFIAWSRIGCTQSEGKPNEIIIDDYRKCSNHELLLEQLKITRLGEVSRKNCRVVLRHGRRCSKMRWEILRTGEQKDRAVKQHFSSPCLDDHHFKKEALEPVQSCVLKCLYLARIGGLDILWSVNRRARSDTKWTQVCDRRLTRLISCSHHTNDFRQYCDVGNTAQHCRLGLFQNQTLLATLSTQNLHQVEHCVFLEAERLSLSVGCTRNKRQYPAVLQILKSFLWMLDCAWMDCLLSTSGTWKLRCCVQQTILQDKVN